MSRGPGNPRPAPGFSTFVRRWASDPLNVGAIAPSGPALAERMVRTLDLAPGHVCVELGPGTGAFTGRLLTEAKRHGARVLLLERDPVFVRHLRLLHPEVEVIEGDAGALPALLAERGIGHVDRVLSGLPVRSFPEALRTRIGEAIGAALKPGGLYVQFTYFTAEPLDRPCARRMHLHGRRTSFVLRNVPPAFVWRYEKGAG
ncbi:MAG: rRNA adenine N-6-methyltransferase family protein [Hyphomicrobiales bacterium]